MRTGRSASLLLQPKELSESRKVADAIILFRGSDREDGWNLGQKLTGLTLRQYCAETPLIVLTRYLVTCAPEGTL